ncbi:exodeoxyribonuclease III [Agaricicola taiwanensis]|uniref:Exodeoxyribonuclease III n=1 Tax=Agaricicola taiwanensis TaxID=591372 RepID=A0A8J2YIK0_9RHOB|nr:exodeoxyribonuclease III [Agaricicola taiwanensis]GGE45290.1 exodeoxyribonuclease III [Agaricicola taiwanensis]
MRIATWNVNSIRQRLDYTVGWLRANQPDVVCLQELKCTDDAFPRLEIEGAGYNVAVHGQKGFNGVAILSRHPLEDVMTGLPGDDADEQSRYLEATISTDGGSVRIASIYLPNGNPIASPKFDYKLAWMDRLTARARMLLELEVPVVLAGDYNIIPMPIDARFPENWLADALFQPESRGRFRALAALGYTDALRACSDDEKIYSFWDYQAGAFQKNNGIRIDHLMLSPQAADRLKATWIDRDERARDKPSDHVPVVVELEIPIR